MEEVIQTPQEIYTIERQISEFMANKGQRATSIEQLEEVVGLNRKQLWAAIRRLESKRKLFRFDVDERNFFVPWKYRKQAYAPVAEKIIRDDKIAALYAAFGTRSPTLILRTPAMRQDDDDPRLTYNRYLDDDDLGDGWLEAKRENLEIHEHAAKHVK